MKLRRYRWAFLLAGGTVILALITVGILLARDAGTPAPEAPYPRPGGAMSAQEAYDLLQPWASRWAADAELLAVTSAAFKERGDEAPWTFLLYSQQQELVATVAVRDTEVLVLREQATLYPQHPLPAGAWQVDSDAALGQWWTEQGAALWETPDTHSLYVQLRRGAQGGAVWQLQLLDAEGLPLHAWSLNAATGEPYASVATPSQ